MTTTDPFATPATDGDPFATPVPAFPPAATPAAADDPFAEPLYDPATGELLDTTDEEPSPTTAAPAGYALEVPGILAGAATGALPELAADLPAFTGALRRALEERVGAIQAAAMKARPAGVLNASAVAGELRALSDAHETLDAIGKTFVGAGRIARDLAGEVVLEVQSDRRIDKEGGSTSLRVGAGGGQDLKVTTTQPTEVWTDTGGIVDVLAAAAVGQWAAAQVPAEETPIAGYAAGARWMAGVLLGLGDAPGLLASPKWKSSALDGLRRDLESLGDGALAGRLDQAFGRRPVGEVQTKVERVDASKRSRTV